jgi:transforming growth factor-beta-induced protein
MANNKVARINVYLHNSKVTIQGCVISQLDLTASNGIIHVLDNVMLAPTGNIVDYVAGHTKFSTLLSLVQQAGIADTLKMDGLTVFAPTNGAFSKIPVDTLNSIKNDTAKLVSVLTYHVVNGTHYSAGLWQREHLATLNPKDDLVVHFLHQHDVKVDNGLVKQTNIGTTNGVIHVVDHVLIPQKDPSFVG